MLDKDTIRQQLSNTLDETGFKGLGDVQKGKVRDSYIQKDRRILITTDRISAFDRVLGAVPFKGQVLNQLAAFWFRQTQDIIGNHVLSVPDPNVMVVRECEQLPLEFIVRGYLTGVTKTSAWYNYEKGERNICGNQLPDGMKKDQRFEKPILTPTTKHEEHDRPVSREQAIEEGLIDAETFDAVSDLCLKLFEYGVKYAASRGLILVDTKYEIGRLNGEFVLSDEVHTPDSSRYWFSDSYEELFREGASQRKLDKEYVREWFADQGFRGDGQPPVLTDEVKVEAASRYIEAYEIITGKNFENIPGSINERVSKAIEPFRD